MQRFFAFWYQCARAAFRENTSFANNWAWAVGVPITIGLSAGIAAWTGSANLSTGNGIAGGSLVALGAFLVTWSIRFVARLLNEPVGQVHALKFRIERYEPAIEGRNGRIALEAKKTSSSDDFAVVATITIAKPANDVVLLGQWAEAVFYVDGTARWKWSRLKRLVERAGVHQEEQFAVEIIRRPEEGRDRICILGEEQLLGGAGSANLFQVRLSLAAGSEMFCRRQCYNFGPPGSGKISLPVHLGDVSYVVDEDAA